MISWKLVNVRQGYAEVVLLHDDDDLAWIGYVVQRNFGGWHAVIGTADLGQFPTRKAGAQALAQRQLKRLSRAQRARLGVTLADIDEPKEAQ